MNGWKKVDPRAMAECMAIMAAGPRDGEDGWDVIDRANAVIGIPPRKRRKARPAPTTPIKAETHD